MIQALQGSLQLPVWGGIPDCGDDTAIPSADPIAPRPGESLITAFGRHAAGRGHDSRRTDPALIAASRRHTRKRKAFLAGPNQTRSFPIPDSDASEDPECRRHPRGDDCDEDPDDAEDMNDDDDPNAPRCMRTPADSSDDMNDDDDPNAPRCMRPPADSSDDNKNPPPQPSPPHSPAPLPPPPPPPPTVSLTPARPRQQDETPIDRPERPPAPPVVRPLVPAATAVHPCPCPSTACLTPRRRRQCTALARTPARGTPGTARTLAGRHPRGTPLTY